MIADKKSIPAEVKYALIGVFAAAGLQAAACFDVEEAERIRRQIQLVKAWIEAHQ